jgi:hypothetical protein
MSNDTQKIDAYLLKLEVSLLRRYNHYRNIAQERMCPERKCQVSPLIFDAFNINMSALKEAITQIKMDIQIILLRRGSLIGNLHMSEGKIAGIIAYRLARAHIINISRICNNGCRLNCFAQLNLRIAICVGLEYIHKKYMGLPAGIRQELSYTMRYRHVNQEMLGLVFDTLNNEEFCHTKNNTKKTV